MENKQMDKIPEMKIENGKVIEETISVDIVVNGKTEQIVLRKLSSGVQGRIRTLCTKTKFLAGQPQITINDAELESQLLQAAIVSAPFPTDLAGIKDLPSEVGSYLLSKWSNFTKSSSEKKD